MIDKRFFAETSTWEDLFGFLDAVLAHRVRSLKEADYDGDFPDVYAYLSQDFLDDFSRLAVVNDIDAIALALAVVPHLRPNYMERNLSVLLPPGQSIPEMALFRGKEHEILYPTFNTLLFLLAGLDLANRRMVTDYLLSESSLIRSGILSIGDAPAGDALTSGRLLLDEEYADLALTGRIHKPKFGANFPAKRIETELEWENLVLPSRTLKQIREIESWLKYNDLILKDWGLQGKIKPGYRVLFYGAPGTGKTLTASLLGKYTGRDVYRVDLSLVVSKYIGETEKNLSRLFDKAINKEWILFFDEADAIFGKRTAVRDAHDKYANQEVSYLLQRVESHPGLVILASNLKNNMDSAFTRRFQSIIEFEMPGATERLALWTDNLPKRIGLEKEVSLETLARNYSLSGANIVNVVQFACLRTAEENGDRIRMDHLLEGIRKEYVKEGKMFA